MSLCEDVVTSNASLYTNRLDSGQVRLFRLEQPSGQCSFETHQLSQAPTYVAVSYTWGSPESSVYADEAVATRDGVPRYLSPASDGTGRDGSQDDDSEVFFLDVGGRRYRVFRSVHDLVTRLINGGTNGRFWIDALCINQADPVERSAQVEMMGDIYHSATNVMVWLGGDERGEADQVARMCRAISAEFWRQLDGDRSANASVGQMPNLFEPDMLEKLGLPPATDEAWNVFARFWDRRWFNRAWVVQEITLTDYPRYWWGSTEFDRRMLMDVSCFILQSGLALATRRGSSRVELGAREWFTLRRRIGETLAKIRAFKLTAYSPPAERQMTDSLLFKCDALAGPATINGGQRTDCMRLWASMLETYRAFDATDPRDHIYATLGIINAAAANHGLTRPGIMVDYTRTVAEVFADTARHIMQTSKCVNLVSLAQDPQMRKQPGLASWVPDFSARGEMPMLLQKAARWKVMPALYSMARSAAKSASATFEVRDDLRVLDVEALQLDEIEAVGESFYELTNGGMWERTAQLLLSRPHFTSRSASESRIESFWRTLVANASFGGQEIAPSEMAADFTAFLTVSLVMATVHDANHLDKLPTWKIVTQIETHTAGDHDSADTVLPSFEEIRALAATVTRRMTKLEAGRELVKETPVASRASRFASAMEPMYYRRVFVTRGGYLGIGPLSAQAGDEIWVLPGAPLATVLRKTKGGENDGASGGKPSYTVLGEAYLHGDPGSGAEKAERERWEWIQLR